MNFNKQYDLYLNSVNNYLHSLLDSMQGEIYDAMRYSLYAGGKRIRPILSLAVSDSLNGEFDAALCYGSAIEMIHTYSLIHDDLPCMDNDDLRRGKPTNHVVFGENMAVLAGDALLNYACESVVNSNSGNDKMKLLALKEIFEASGSMGMIGGQVIDIRSENKVISEGELKTLHRKKTGALIKAASRVGVVSAGENINLFDEYAEAIGLAFQIRDDILDVEGNVEIFGKPIKSDEKNNKTTYVSLYGIDGAKHRLSQETDKALESISFLGDKGEFLREFALYLLNREN